MKHYLVITPQPLIKALVSESKRLVKAVYEKDVNLLYYRVQTKQKLDNPRRLFIKGDGQVLEAQVGPHISLVHNIELDGTKEFGAKVKNICSMYEPLKLEYKGVGNYGMDFTFFIQFKENPILEKLRAELLEVSREYMSKEEHAQHIDGEFIPHATVLYDDIDPEKVLKAYKLLDRSKFKVVMPVKEIAIWEMSTKGQNHIASFKLGK